MHRRILLSLMMLSMITVFGLILGQPSVTEAQTTGTWSTEFYNNTSFSPPQAATAVYTDSQLLNLNFSTPPAGVLQENFSAIFTSTRSLNPGNYTISVTVDDRAEVLINNQSIINITQPNTSQAANYSVTAVGTYTIQIRFIQFTGPSYIQFSFGGGTGVAATPGGPTFTPIPTIAPTNTPLPPIPPGAITATVIRASVLNVRDAPSLGGIRIGRILRGQTYAIVGRDDDARWFLLQLSGYQAWAYGYYLFVDGNEFNPPIVSGNTVLGLAGLPDYGVRGQSEATLRLREGPSVGTRQIGRVTWGAFVPIIGRTPDGFWYKTVWKNTVGWIYSPFVEIVEGDLNIVPFE